MTTNEVIKRISQVKHPAIDFSLLELGIVKNIRLMDVTVALEFCFPFANIPIADKLISSVEEPIREMGLLPVYKITTMTEEEKQKFLKMESQAWIG